MDERNSLRDTPRHVDVLILTAVQDELEAVLALASGWNESRDNEGFRLHIREFVTSRGRPFTVATAWIGEMGKQSAAIRGKQLLDELHPTCLAMCGVCAGYRHEVALGDIIVADQIWAVDNGKHVVEVGKTDVFYHALRTFDLQANWKMDAAFLAREFDSAVLQAKRPPPRETQLRWILHTLYLHETQGTPAPMNHPDRPKACPAWTDLCRQAQGHEWIIRKGAALVLTDKGRDAVEADFVEYPDGLPAIPDIRVHVGAIATVSAVEKDAGIFERLRRHVRNTIGLEMEGSAIGDLAQRFDKRSILVKAVQDHADGSKDDATRHFACEAAAKFLMTFLEKHFEPERIAASREKRAVRRDFDGVWGEGRQGRPETSNVQTAERDDSYLSRVEQIAALHHPAAKITRRPAEPPFSGLLDIEVASGGFYETHLIAALDSPISSDVVQHFIRHIERPFRDRHPFLRSTVVHQGESAFKESREETYRRHNVKLTTFREYQGLFDLTAYLRWQTARLEANGVYPPHIYVDPPATYEVSGSFERHRIENALRFLWDLLAAPDQRRFALVLGEFGAGKTFLLRELCRRMVIEKHPVWPVLVEMDKLEKRHDLATLLAAHFAQADVPGFNFKAFQYMLEEGRIALLFDGFDELADRVTYDTVNAHFDTVLSAARGGQAKVVLSSRRQHFLSEAQVKLDLARRAEMVHGFHMVLLLPFQELQIRNYLQNVLGDAAAARERYALIDDIKDLLGLSHNPRMLGFIVNIPEASLREAKRQQGTITAAGLYDLLVAQWLDGEYERERRRSTRTGISRKALGQGMTALAAAMWQAHMKTVDVVQIREVLGEAMRHLGEPALDSEIVTHLFASGSLLVRDADARFSFVHRSVMEWLVAQEAAREVVENADSMALDGDEMSPLMADFFSSMAGRAKAVSWARGKLFGPEKGIATKNAALVLQRLGESFERVNLAGQDLRGKDFSGAAWRDADLHGTNLEGATLVGTDLSGANLEGACLLRANLTEANLDGARLGGADLRQARLFRANLHNCVGFETARLFRTNFAGAIVPKTWNTAATDPFGTPARFDQTEPMTVTAEASGASVAFDATGNLLAAGFGDGTVRLFDAATGESLRILSGHTLAVGGVVFNPHDRTLASGSDDATVRVWDVARGEELQCLEGHAGYVWNVAFSPDGKTLASSSSDRTIRLWDVSLGETTCVLTGHHHAVVSVTWSPDGKLLASASSDKTVRLWDVDKRLCVRVIEGHDNAVLSVAFSPDGTWMATGSSDKTVRLWHATSGEQIGLFQGHKHAVYSVTFSSDGKSLASGSADRTVRIWDLSSNQTRQTLQGHASHVKGIAFSPDGELLVSASNDNTVRSWDTPSGKPGWAFIARNQFVLDVGFGPDGSTIVAVSYGIFLHVWHAHTGRLLYASHLESDSTLAATFGDRRSLVCEKTGRKLQKWDIAQEQPVWTSPDLGNGIDDFTISPEGTTIAATMVNETVWLLDSTSGQTVQKLKVAASTSAFDPNGRTLAIGSPDGIISSWNVESGRQLRFFEAHEGRILRFAYTPDGKILASASSDETIRLWSVSTGKSLATIAGHGRSVTSLIFSPDGKTLASASTDKTIRLWNVASGQEIHCLRGHLNAVRSVAFHPQGHRLVSGSVDNTLRLWDVASGRCLAILSAMPDGWVAFTPHGRYKFGGNLGGSFWHVVGLCRFEAGEIDAFLPHLRLAEDAPIV